MSGGVVEQHIDDEPLATGTHDGADGAAVLSCMGAMFRSLGVTPVLGQYVENETQTTGGAVTASTDDTVTVDGVTWDNGDTYNVYKTATKDSAISSTLTDVSRGWKADPDEMVDGWRPEDKDLDDHGKHRVFGPGQPEK